MKHIKQIIVVILLGVFFSSSLYAQRIPAFFLEGALKQGETIRMTPQNLEGEWVKEFRIYDPYLKEEVTYRGVPMDEFIAHFGESEISKLVITATDGYSVTFTQKEWESKQIMLVFQTDGKYMGLRDLGPLRVVYKDYDAKMIDIPSYFIGWIWMIRTIEFKK